MARIVFSGLLDRLPEMKIVTHHLGAMIPYFEGRVGPLWDQLGSRTSDEDYGALLKRIARRPIEYFRLFYGDTERATADAHARARALTTVAS